MFGYRFHFVRRFFRRFMTPITVEEAEAKKAFLAKGYFFISLVAFTSVLYQVKKGRLDWVASEGLVPDDELKLSPGMFTILSLIVYYHGNNFFFFFIAFQYARMLGVDKATVIRMKGVNVLGSKDYDKESFDPTQHVLEEENAPLDPERKFLQL
ncbi:uncharacterized protein LOC114124212 isoform X1 [Aphis gossypii]|uniref:uncharacterized protein LOC114124212 isoform X1 n=1 Tax=Aphis gossypii TaxID=80765 RepID=UPI00215985DB|nr:uncharacterized protein LOC114124212 isoform X1 [Aphis gossypii]